MKRRILTCFDGPLEGLGVEMYGADWRAGQRVELRREAERWRQEGGQWHRPMVTYVYKVQGDVDGVLHRLVFFGGGE